MTQTEQNGVDVTVVMPCLNEADTLFTCIEKARTAMRTHNISGEIVVADNGSTDGSIDIAKKAGARVVHVRQKGYGSALMGGIEAAHGKFIVMGDADDSYDFGEVPRFVAKLNEGFDLVQGCRLPSGGGKIEEGATPWSHRWIGGPFFRWMIRTWFNAPINDVHCGLRAFRKDHYARIEQRCTGMEFASEMIIKSCLYGAKISEVPITLHKDGRIAHPPHLRTIRDGWRHLRFMLIYSPRYVFILPALLLILFGLIGYLLALPRLSIHGVTFDANTLLFSSLGIICGFQSLSLALFTKVFAVREGLMPASEKAGKFVEKMSVEKSLLLGLSATVLGGSLLLTALYQWYQARFGPLDYTKTIRFVIPGATLVTLGFQTIISSFVIGMFKLGRK